jgi:NADH-quinone oxidoreductase subunit K/NAD(P)H-quinone oxidoreductase subunit 4L
MGGPGLVAYLVVGALMFAIGIFGALSQRGAIMVLMGLEIILNAAILNLVAFWRFVNPGDYAPQVFVIVAMTIGAVEMAVGLGIVLMIYRKKGTQNIDKFSEMKE